MEKKETYKRMLSEAEGLMAGEHDMIANLANLCALIRERFGFFWIGFYLVKGNELVLGPFQGPVACTRIAHGRGVCGTSWAKAESIIVQDVHESPGHIACSALSQSEIVVPVMVDGKVSMVLDIDSDQLSTFDEVDEAGLQSLCWLISSNEKNWK